METLPSANSTRIARVVLATCAAVSLLAMAADLGVNSVTAESLHRSAVYILVFAFAIIEIRSPSRPHLLTAFLGAMIGIFSLIDTVYGTSFSLLDPGSALAFMILVAVTFVVLLDYQSPVAVVVYSVAIAGFSIATVSYGEGSATHAIGFLVVGVPGQALVLWIVFRLITTLAKTSKTDATHARIQRALAECSQALLTRGSTDSLTIALKALLNATEAYYAYVDVSGRDEAGRNTWEIVADASGEGYPDKEPTLTKGTYEQLGSAEELLAAGRPAEVIVSELSMPLRGLYEAEGIKSELIAPIHIGERWVGSLGYTDHIRAGDWSPIEVEGLMRAAEMVGAFWEREAAREGLMELAQAKDRFVATVSHELRTPLAAVVGFAGELAEGVGSYSPAEITEISKMIYTQGLELTHLVDDLLTSERAASGNLTIKIGPVEILAECQGIVDTIALDREVPVVGEPVTVSADSLRVRQIVRNLLTNAFRYGGRSVAIDVQTRDGSALITVRDDGPGVGFLDGERIFDHYYRSKSEATVPDSVGLGLAVARELARLMGGDIIYRRSDGWTRFELTLPIVDATEAQSLNGGSPDESTLSSHPILS